MGQDFLLVNLDKRQKQQFSNLVESFYEFGLDWQLSGWKSTLLTASEYIAARKKDAEEARSYAASDNPRPAYIYHRSSQTQSALLRKLPVEAVSMCLSFADTLRTKVCFALTCQDAWDIARCEVTRELRASDSWAGDRIICIGDWAFIDDFPPNVLTGEELATLNSLKAGNWRRSPEGRVECIDTANGSGGGPGTSTATAEEISRLSLTDLIDALGMTGIPCPTHDIFEWLRTKRYEARNLEKHSYRRRECEEDHSRWMDLIRTRFNLVKPAGAILRNLTTHEYVRGDAFLAARDNAPDSYSPIHTWSLGDSLILRICWSRDDGLWKDIVGSDSRCAWAGHRFDFASEASLPRDEDGKVLAPWKDASEDFINELLLCSSLYQNTQ